MLHGEDASLSRVAGGSEDRDRRGLARNVEPHGAPEARRHVQFPAAEIGLAAGDQVVCDGVEILAKANAKAVIIGACERHRGGFRANPERGVPLQGDLRLGLVDRQGERSVFDEQGRCARVGQLGVLAVDPVELVAQADALGDAGPVSKSSLNEPSTNFSWPQPAASSQKLTPLTLKASIRRMMMLVVEGRVAQEVRAAHRG